MIYNILSSNEITDILNNPIVKTNKTNLSSRQNVVQFSFPLDDIMKTKLENSLSINLTKNTTIPMRWIKGDTLPHTDKGEKHFNNTYLVYLTDSIGNLIVDGQTYPITAGDAHIFNEGLEHSTINTGNSERLMIGPMSESGFRVGAISDYKIFYYNNETDANNNENIMNASVGYIIQEINGISLWIVFNNTDGIDPSPNGGPYAAGFELVNTGLYRVYKYIPPPPRFSMRSVFSNNAQVYYKPHSLSTGSGGSGVRNSRHKQRKT